MRRSILVLVALGAVAACARVEAPRGWLEDRTPPRLVSTRPANLAVLPDFSGEVVFKFDERVSDQGISDQLAVVSPDTGLPHVSKHGSEIHVRPRLGWRKGVVYQVVLLPGFRDMFNNAAREPAQVVFSTGPAIRSTVIAGILKDRITGQPAASALVQAVHAAQDSLTYTTASDTAGFFALRFLPEGRYIVRAYIDRNKDRHPQYREPQATVRADLVGGRDTVIVDSLALLPNDSTHARLAKAEYRDSVQIRASFDDYLDPARGLGGVAVNLWHLPDSVAVPVVGLFFPTQFDSLKVARDTSAAGRKAAAATVRADSAKRLLPTQEIVIVPGRPLAAKSRYRVTVSGVTNINGLPGGSGSQTFSTPEPAKPPTAADSARAGQRPPAAGAAARPSGAPPSRAPATAAPPPAARDTSRR